MRILLASSSPRREFLLRSVGLDVLIEKPDIDESAKEGETPRELVLRLAEEKSRAVVNIENLPVIAADTIVTIDGEILGKPIDSHDAVLMLSKLSGRTHEVLTGFCVRHHGQSKSDVVTTKILFRKLSKKEIETYIATGEPLDKSGSYAIQSGGAYLIDRIEGSYSNVIGLPLQEVLNVLLGLHD